MTDIFFILVILFVIIFIFSAKIADYFYDKENYQQALFFYRISSLTTQEYSIYNLIGNCYAELNQNNKAVDAYKKSLFLFPQGYSANKNIGLVYLDKGELKTAEEYFLKAYYIKHGEGYDSKPLQVEQDLFTGSHKLKHDIEQLQYLIEKKLIPDTFKKDIDNYVQLITEIPEDKTLVQLNEKQKTLIENIYDRNIYLEKCLRLDNALNPENDYKNIEKSYFENKPNYIFFDNFLTDKALNSILEFCLNSTIWNEYKRSRGYLASYMDNGFSNELLYQISEEIRKALPEIFKDYLLMNMWAFKYDSNMQGVVTHADQAMLNVNFWITPDSANYDPESGGMAIYNVEAPKDWDFEKYNKDTELIKDFLENNNAVKKVIPYKQNRVVIFNSGLFHETDKYSFKKGYENRRVNITMLFGKRK